MKRFIAFASVLILTGLSTLTANAEVPQLITYQGLLADSAGNPANGLFLIQFRIYDDPSAGSLLWDNGFRTVQVTDGLFAYSLGDSTAFPADLFDGSDRWLGIKVGVDPEISPRKQLVSSPYSMHSAKADSVGTDVNYVHVAGDEMNGNLSFDIGDDGDNEIVLFTSSGRGQLSLLDNGNQRFILGSLSNGGFLGIQDDLNFLLQVTGDNTFGGTVTLAQADGATGASLAGGTDASQSALRLYDNAGSPSVTLLGNSTGDGAALLPDNSVSSTEILDNSVSGTDIADGTVNGFDVADNSLSASDITDNTLMSADIAAGAILSGEIADGAVTSVDIADGSVTTVDIADGTITAIDISDGSIISADIATGGVTTSDILDGGIALIDLSGGIVPAVGSVELGSGITATIATPTTLDSFIVNSPGTGYLWVTVMGQYYFSMAAPASTSIIEAGAIGLCTSPASDATCDGTYELVYYQDSEDATPNGLNHTQWFSLQRVIPVIATSYTFYINGEATSASGYDLNLYQSPKATALFVPNTLTVSASPYVPESSVLEQK